MPGGNSSRSRKYKAAFILSMLVYFLIAAEIIIMISPFAAYFFSVYTPALEFLAKSPRLAWTTDFFLPHLVFTGDWLVKAVSFLQILFPVGLALFLLAALPLYYQKVLKKQMVQRGPYALVRHPQYLALSISGFGLLIYWPRFIILLLYVTMLFVYYALARNEEWRCKRRYGAPYEEYLKRTPMFMPGAPGGKAYKAAFGWIRPRWAGMTALYLIALAGSGLAAAGLRVHSENTITKYIYTYNKTPLMAVPVYPARDSEILGIVHTAVDAANTRRITMKGTNLAYVMPADFFLMAVVTGEPRRPTDSAGNINKPRASIADFFRIFFNYLEALAGSIYSVSNTERVIFVEATSPTGRTVLPEDSLGIGLTRTPRAMADIDLVNGRVVEVKELAGGNKWGGAPMPAF